MFDILARSYLSATRMDAWAERDLRLDDPARAERIREAHRTARILPATNRPSLLGGLRRRFGRG